MDIYSIDNIMKASSFDPNEITKFSKIRQQINFQKIKDENPKLTQDQICKMMGTTSSTLNRNRHDINMNSPYIHPVPLKHSPKKHVHSSVNDISKKQVPGKVIQDTNKKKGRPKIQSQNNNEIGGSLNIINNTLAINGVVIDDDYIDKLIS